ncbi:regulation of AMPA receptor [Branchiostoma belcheri]|nr:regulation of AMPA receptor [Branchiostoma belcheri]
MCQRSVRDLENLAETVDKKVVKYELAEILVLRVIPAPFHLPCTTGERHAPLQLQFMMDAPADDTIHRTRPFFEVCAMVKIKVSRYAAGGVSVRGIMSANGSGCAKISTFGPPLGKNYGPREYTTDSIMSNARIRQVPYVTGQGCAGQGGAGAGETCPGGTCGVISSAMPFPVVSLGMTFLGCVVSTIGHVNPRRKLNAFASGILFILSGLFTVVGLIVYISAINDEVMHRDKKNADSSFHYQYSWSFFMAAMSFGLTELSGVLSIYLFIRLYMSDDEEKARSRHAVARRAMYPAPCLSAPPTPRGSTYDHAGYPCRSLSNDGPYAPRSPSSNSLGGYKMRNSSTHPEGGYPFLGEYKARNSTTNPAAAAEEEGYPMSYQTAIVIAFRIHDDHRRLNICIDLSGSSADRQTHVVKVSTKSKDEDRPRASTSDFVSQSESHQTVTRNTV